MATESKTKSAGSGKSPEQRRRQAQRNAERQSSGSGDLSALLQLLNQAQADRFEDFDRAGVFGGIRSSSRNRGGRDNPSLQSNQLFRSPDEVQQRIGASHDRFNQNAANPANILAAVQAKQAEQAAEQAAATEGLFRTRSGQNVVMQNGRPVGFSGANNIDLDAVFPTDSGIPMAAFQAFGTDQGPNGIFNTDRSSASSLDAQDARGAAIEDFARQLLEGGVAGGAPVDPRAAEALAAMFGSANAGPADVLARHRQFSGGVPAASQAPAREPSVLGEGYRDLFGTLFDMRRPLPWAR